MLLDRLKEKWAKGARAATRHSVIFLSAWKAPTDNRLRKYENKEQVSGAEKRIGRQRGSAQGWKSETGVAGAKISVLLRCGQRAFFGC